MVSSQTPPHGLQLVIDFVNTEDLDRETDEIPTPEALADWLHGHLRDVPASVPGPSQGEYQDALGLREALRSLMLAHNGGGESEAAGAMLDRVARLGQLGVSFRADGSSALVPQAEGFPGALAALLVPVVESTADGTWKRVKACADDGCAWAFYDQSRNRSGRWCDMALCGNRTKVKAYRSRQNAG